MRKYAGIELKITEADSSGNGIKIHLQMILGGKKDNGEEKYPLERCTQEKCWKNTRTKRQQLEHQPKPSFEVIIAHCAACRDHRNHRCAIYSEQLAALPKKWCTWVKNKWILPPRKQWGDVVH